MNRKFLSNALALSLITWGSLSCSRVITFPNLKERLLLSSEDARNPGNPFTAKDCPDCRFDIRNASGQAWTDFHLEIRLGRGPGGSFGFMEGGGGFDGDVYEGSGTDALSNLNHTLDVTGLNIADGSTYSFTVDVGDVELEGTWELFGRPTTEPPP
jgi:hypothetical protein